MVTYSEETNQLIEDIKNEDNIVRKAKLVEKALHQNNLKVIELARALGVSAAYVSRYQRISRLPEAVSDGYLSGMLSASHLLVISRLKNPEDMMEIYEQVLAGNLAVHRIEDLIRKKLFDIDGIGKRIDRYTLDLIEDAALGIDRKLTVKVTQTRIGMKVLFEAKGNLEKTSNILKRLASRLELH